MTTEIKKQNRQIKLLKLFAVASLLFFAPSTISYAQVGGDNGGDPCDKRFKQIRDNLKNWITVDNWKGLVFSKTDAADTYKTEMLSAIARASISCTTDKVFVKGAEKTCKNTTATDGKISILCNIKRFMKPLATDDQNEELGEDEESIQYGLVHHEYAGPAKFEVDTIDGSDYHLSRQLSHKLTEVVVKMLPIVSTVEAPASHARVSYESQTLSDLSLSEVSKISTVDQVLEKLRIGKVNGGGHILTCAVTIESLERAKRSDSKLIRRFMENVPTSFAIGVGNTIDIGIPDGFKGKITAEVSTQQGDGHWLDSLADSTMWVAFYKGVVSSSLNKRMYWSKDFHNHTYPVDRFQVAGECVTPAKIDSSTHHSFILGAKAQAKIVAKENQNLSGLSVWDLLDNNISDLPCNLGNYLERYLESNLEIMCDYGEYSKGI